MRTLVIAAVFLIACSKPGAPQRIAVIDLQRAVKQSKAGVAAQERLTKRFDESQASLDAEQAKLKLEIAAGDPEADAKLTALQQRFTHLQDELKSMQDTELAPLMSMVGVQLERIAKDRELDAVLEVQSVPWMKPELDLTDEVIRAVDAAP